MGSEAWVDPRTHIAVVGGCVGIAGFLWGILSFHWNRRESRLDALSKVLQPLIRAAQQLREANGARRKCELLRCSFPDAQSKEAATRVNEMVDRYNTLIADSQEQFKLAESENEARCFRFPDKIARLVQTALHSLSEMGRQANDGKFEQVELQFAKFADDYAAVKRAGRGLRLAVPLEGFWKRVLKKEAA